jgi:N-acetylglucosaminyl-diphospho-decaprenol L-rhamnosyltransferase
MMAESTAAANDADTFDLSVIIVSWNTRDLLADCLHSINAGRGALAVEVIVVDGGSSDGSPEMIAENFPWVQLEARPENVGFPKGNNIGLAKAGGRLLLLLNPDTVIIGEALATMAHYLGANPEVGIVGPKLLNPDGSIQSSRRRFPTFATGLFESTWFQPFAPRSLMEGYYAADLPDDVISDVDWLVGACLMTRRDVLESIGPLDEAYFMYSEELDWCRRVKEAGWRVVFLPEAQIVHHVGKSSDQAVTERHINYQRAKLRYFRKFHGRVPAAILRINLLFNYLVQIVLEGAKGVLGIKRSLRWQRVRAYWAVIRTGLKPAGY